jgi:thiamine kinase-like enzyme
MVANLKVKQNKQPTRHAKLIKSKMNQLKMQELTMKQQIKIQCELARVKKHMLICHVDTSCTTEFHFI